MKHNAVLVALFFALFGCANDHSAKKDEVRNQADEQLKTAEQLLTRNQYTQSDTPLLAVNKKPVSIEQNLFALLRQKKVSYQKGADPVPLAAILESLNAQGINIGSSIRLDSFKYQGFSINGTDAITALEILTGSLGLDFAVQKGFAGEPIVFINALTAETKRLNIGPRNLTSNMGTNSDGQGGQQQQQQQQQGSIQIPNTLLAADSTASIESKFQDDFWARLSEELNQRLTRPVPKQPKEGNAQDDGQLYDFVKLGQVVVNSSTGSITVMAPRTIRQELMDYLSSIDNELNSTVVLRGQVIIVNNTDENTEGIDWSGLRNTGEGVIAFSNDVIGNTAISAPGEFADAIGSNALAPSILGYARADRVLKVFNGYLQKDSRTTTLQMPVAQTASGVPVNLSEVSNEYQIIAATNQATSAEGTTNTGVTNNILTFQYGTNLTLTPRVDYERGLIRTDVNLKLKIKQGSAVLNQVISSGNSARLEPLELPLIKDLSYQGQALVKPGEVIVMGGQKVDLISDNGGGITGLKDGLLGGLFGSKKKTKQSVTYYFLLSAYTVPYGS